MLDAHRGKGKLILIVLDRFARNSFLGISQLAIDGSGGYEWRCEGK
jgi:hypothetical protein